MILLKRTEDRIEDYVLFHLENSNLLLEHNFTEEWRVIQIL